MTVHHIFGQSMLVLRRDEPPGKILHGIDGHVADGLEVRLKSRGLDPQKDSDSFHVREPAGLNVQVGDRGLGPSSFIESGFRTK